MTTATLDGQRLCHSYEKPHRSEVSVLVRENALDIEAPLCSVELQRGITNIQGVAGNKKPRECEV